MSEHSFAGVRALVIGYGSIGRRHAKILRESGAAVSIVTADTTEPGSHRTISAAVAAAAPEYAIVSNPTAKHLAALEELQALGFSGRLLVEKPLFAEPADSRAFETAFPRAAVGYNLRFHPLISKLREHLRGQRVIGVRMHVGQHLADWRPETSYREGSSARRALGGGALRDLSHELDLMSHLFGPWRRASAIGGNYGVLEIETDEYWSILFELETGAVATVTLSYLDRPAERKILVETDTRTLRVDLINGTFAVDAESLSVPFAINDTYLLQHQAILSGRFDVACSLRQGAMVLETIAAIETAASAGEWVRK